MPGAIISIKGDPNIPGKHRESDLHPHLQKRQQVKLNEGFSCFSYTSGLTLESTQRSLLYPSTADTFSELMH